MHLCVALNTDNTDNAAKRKLQRNMAKHTVTRVTKI